MVLIINSYYILENKQKNSGSKEKGLKL